MFPKSCKKSDLDKLELWSPFVVIIKKLMRERKGIRRISKRNDLKHQYLYQYSVNNLKTASVDISALTREKSSHN